MGEHNSNTNDHQYNNIYATSNDLWKEEGRLPELYCAVLCLLLCTITSTLIL